MTKPSRRFASSLLGQRLIEAGHLDEEKLQQALAMQKETGLLLGEVCILKGWIDYTKLHECLPPLRSKLGDKLLAKELITMDQLWLAILEQRKSGEKLGEVLVKRGWLHREQLDEILASQ